MPLRLVTYADDAVEGLKSPRVQKAAAEAMEQAMTDGVRVAIGGGDLRLSHWRGAPMAFDASYTAGTGVTRLPLSGGTYALADEGRHKARKRIVPKRRKRKGQRRPTLSTPYGPRVSVKGSTWPGFHLTDRLAPKVLDKAEEAARAEGAKAFAQIT